MAQMVKDGLIDGFTSGSPWPQAARLDGCGEVLFSDPDYWTLKPEKILAVRAAWSEEHEGGTGRLDPRPAARRPVGVSQSGNREDLIRIVARRVYCGAPFEAVAMALHPVSDQGGSGLVLDPRTVTFPWISHAKWFLGQMVRWGWLSPDHDFDQLARHIYRPDLWREAAGSLGFDLPLADEKDEGGQPRPWSLPATPNPITMPPNVLFDGGVFKCEERQGET